MSKEKSGQKKKIFSMLNPSRFFPLDRSTADKTIEPGEQKSHPWRIFFLFFGFMLCVSFATYGSIILRYRISFWQAIAITGAAAALIFALVALFALAGNRLGVTTSGLSRYAFGTSGAKIIAGFLALSNLVLAAYFLTDVLYKTDEAALISGIQTTFDFPFFLYLSICIIICVLGGLLAFFGGHIIMKASVLISAFFIIVIITAIVNAKRYFNLDYALDLKPGTPFEMISALFLLFGAIAFVVIPVASDFGRLIRTRNAVDLSVSEQQCEQGSSSAVARSTDIPTSAPSISKSCQRSKLIQSVFFGGFLGLLCTLGVAIFLGSSYTEFKHYYGSKPLIGSLTWSTSENRLLFWIAILLVYLLIVSIFLYSASLAFGFLFPKVKKKWFAIVAAVILLAYCTLTVVLVKNATFHIFAILPIFTISIAALMGVLFAKILSFARNCAKAHHKGRRAIRETAVENKWHLYSFVSFVLAAVLGFGFSQPIYTYESPIAFWLGFISQPIGILESTWYSPTYAHILAFLLAFLLIFFEGSFKFLFNLLYIIFKNKKVGV